MRRPDWATNPATWERAKTSVRRKHGISSGDRFEELVEAAYVNIGGRIHRPGFRKAVKLGFTLRKALPRGKEAQGSKGQLIPKRVFIHGGAKKSYWAIRYFTREEIEQMEGKQPVDVESGSRTVATEEDYPMVPGEEPVTEEEAEKFLAGGAESWREKQDEKELQSSKEVKFVNRYLPYITDVTSTSSSFTFAPDEDRKMDAALEKMGNGGDLTDQDHKLLSAWSAAWFDPYQGDKVAIVMQTSTGCPRGHWTRLNGGHVCGGSCYGGGCYATKVRAKDEAAQAEQKEKYEGKGKLQIHPVPEKLIHFYTQIANKTGHFIRDNQNSDGSVSMTVGAHDGTGRSVLRRSLEIMQSYSEQQKFPPPEVVSVSSCYTRPSDEELTALGKHKNLTVHVTVSGWHSKSEMEHRLAEFDRYRKHGVHTILRIVTKKGFTERFKATEADPESKCGAKTQKWLIGEILKRGKKDKGYNDVLWTPYHEAGEFAGSEAAGKEALPVGSSTLERVANAIEKGAAPESVKAEWEREGGSHRREATGVNEPEYIKELRDGIEKNSGGKQGLRQCCSTGRCKTCPSKCFTKVAKNNYRQERTRREKAMTNLERILTSEIEAKKGKSPEDKKSRLGKTVIQNYGEILSQKYVEAKGYGSGTYKATEVNKVAQRELEQQFIELKKLLVTVTQRNMKADKKEPYPAEKIKMKPLHGILKSEEQAGATTSAGILFPENTGISPLVFGGVLSLGLSSEGRSTYMHRSCHQVGPMSGTSDDMARDSKKKIAKSLTRLMNMLKAAKGRSKKVEKVVVKKVAKSRRSGYTMFLKVRD